MNATYIDVQYGYDQRIARVGRLGYGMGKEGGCIKSAFLCLGLLDLVVGIFMCMWCR
jgi:hypothetical protein